MSVGDGDLKGVFGILLVVVLALGSVPLQGIFDYNVSAVSEVGVQNGNVGAKTVPGEVVIGLETPDSDFSNKAKIKGGQVIAQIERLNIFVVKVPENSEDKFITAIENNPNVEFAQKNHIVTATSVPNDPRFSELWGLKKSKFDSAWDTVTGSSTVKVAVVDTGADFGHQDLGCLIKGYDHYYNDNNPHDGGGHGTHVTGTIAATMNNNKGVAGGAPDVCVIVEKVLSDGGSGSDSKVAAGIDSAVQNGADIINLSLGCLCGVNDLPAIKSAVQAAQASGVLVIAAAGNSATSSTFYPAAYPGVVGVGATRNDDTLASYSNYGTDNVDIVAPGGDLGGSSCSDTEILSTNTGGGYACKRGTSMAAPHVAAAAALAKSLDPNLTSNQIAQLLYDTSDDVSLPVSKQGNGRLNAYNLVQQISNNGNPPTNPPLVADAGADQTVTDSNGDGTENVILDGGGSTGNIVSYVWNDGNNDIGFNSIINHDFAIGTTVVTLTVTDDGGASSSDSVSVTVNGPSQASVTITSPAPNSDVSGRMWVVASPDSFAGSTTVKFYIDGAHRDTASSEPYKWRWNANNESVDQHEIKVVASDNFGNTAEHKITVNVVQEEKGNGGKKGGGPKK